MNRELDIRNLDKLLKIVQSAKLNYLVVIKLYSNYEYVGVLEIALVEEDKKVKLEIRALYLEEKYQRKGIGTKIIDNLKDIGLEMFGVTEEGNIGAYRFWESVGAMFYSRCDFTIWEE